MEGDCYPRSPMYSETLARCTRVVYPLDFSGQHRVAGLVCSFGFGYVICMCKAKILTCIAHEARSMAKPYPVAVYLLDFSKCYRMCANGLVTPLR
jgi:hypothetical protein